MKVNCPKCKAEHEKKLKEYPSCGFNRFIIHKAKKSETSIAKKNPSFWKYVALPLFVYFAVSGGSDDKLAVYGLGCFLFLMLVAVYVTVLGNRKGLFEKNARGLVIDRYTPLLQ